MTTLSERSPSLESTVGLPLQPLGRRAVADALPHLLVWHTQPDGRCDYVNGNWCTFTGLRQASAVGAGWQQALYPEDLVRWQAAWEPAARAGQPCDLRYRLRRADGVYGWFLSHVEAIRGEGGAIAGWLGTAVATDDGTSPEQVAAVGRGTTTFITAAVHDLKNELTVIRATAQLLERDLRRAAAMEPTAMLARLTQLQRATTTMRQVVDEVLDLTRLQSDQPVEFNRQPTDLVALVRGCVSTYAQTTDHALTLATTVEALVGDWDATRLERVVGNLVSNAIKYSAPGTAIQVAIDHDGSGRRAVAVVTVQDRGVGIPAADLPHLFAPFYRGSNVVQQTEGTGIGLFGARAIVEQQGGTLDLRSTEGVGTTVMVRLPLTA